MKNVKLTIEQAESVIALEERVHTFTHSFCWMGCDMDRSKILAAIKSNGGAELSDEAASFKHELLVFIDGAPTFIQTDSSKLSQLIGRQKACR